MLSNSLAAVEEFPLESVDRMIAVGSGALQGAALEASLKMLEMTDGRVVTRAETCLGLRHGPMCALHNLSLCFCLCPRPFAASMDLLKADRKGLGAVKVIVGGVPSDPGAATSLGAGLRGLGDGGTHRSVVVGQLPRSCASLEGLRPDEPAVGDSITRVVGEFTLHNLSAEVH